MPVFLLIRHAENDYLKQGRLGGRLPGVHLNEEGRAHAQAVGEALAQRLKEAAPKGIYSSPLERTLETAQTIASLLRLTVIPREGLLETDCGHWSGKTVKSVRRLRLWKAVQQTPSTFQFPGGETFYQCQQRIVAELEMLRTKHDAKDVILCVTHADPIKLAIAHYLGLPLDNFQRLVVSPASVTVLGINEKGGHLLAMNFGLELEKILPA
jgi:probable phosphoglycerate mutase